MRITAATRSTAAFTAGPAGMARLRRIETGISIDPGMLKLVHAAERLVSQALTPRTVRCRVRAKGVVVELDEQNLAALDSSRRQSLSAQVGRLFSDGGFDYPVSLAPYRSGSAFLVRVQRDAAYCRANLS